MSLYDGTPCPDVLPSLHDRYIGRPAVLLGSGPSIRPYADRLLTEDRLNIPNALYIGTNGASEFADIGIFVEPLSQDNLFRAIDARERLITRPTVLRQMYRTYPFLSTENNAAAKRFKNLVKGNNHLPDDNVSLMPQSYKNQALRHGPDGQPAGEVQTGTMAFWLAWYMGCNPIGCLGFDFTFDATGTHYYGEDATTRNKGHDAYQWPETNLMTTCIYRHIRATGRQVYVLSPISKFLQGWAPRLEINDFRRECGGRA